jgi:hypothetical protein
MGGLKEADDFKSKTRAAHRKIGPTLETSLNALGFLVGIQKIY